MGRSQSLSRSADRSPVRVRATRYPLAPRDAWYADANYASTGGRLVEMTPDEYLRIVRPLTLDDVSRENIADLVAHVRRGGELDPLAIYANGKEDGRHRAYAAKKLGIRIVPVLVFSARDRSRRKSRRSR